MQPLIASPMAVASAVLHHSQQNHSCVSVSQAWSNDFQPSLTLFIYSSCSPPVNYVHRWGNIGNSIVELATSMMMNSLKSSPCTPFPKHILIRWCAAAVRGTGKFGWLPAVCPEKAKRIRTRQSRCGGVAGCRMPDWLSVTASLHCYIHGPGG